MSSSPPPRADRLSGATPHAEHVAAVAALDEPTRRRLYDVVARAQGPVSRDEAASQVGVSRGTAAFHLDRLADRGLLEVTYERLTGRTGPGAGRPAKLYRRARSEVAVSLPGRRYDLAGRLLARTVEAVERTGERPRDALARQAHDEGRALGAAGHDLASLLEDCGYEPREVAGDGPAARPTVELANCPFHEMVGEHPALVCGMNLHLLEGVLEGLHEERYCARLDPAEGRCCVRLEPAPRGRATR